MASQESTNDLNKIQTVSSSDTKSKTDNSGASKSKNRSSIAENKQDIQGLSSKFCKHVSINNESTPDTNIKVNDLIAAMDALTLSRENSDDNICTRDWLKAKDSLENLFHPKSEKIGADISNSKSTPFPSKDKSLITDSHNSESIIGTTKSACSSSVSKVLAWDPWDKLGRKTKKDNKKRKFEKSPLQSKDSSPASLSPIDNRKDFTSGDEKRPLPTPEGGTVILGTTETYTTYEYQPYRPARNSKSVEFVNKVMVVYIKEDRVIGESIEPLKKELEQQIRNKEMRKGHMTDLHFSKKRLSTDWFKK